MRNVSLILVGLGILLHALLGCEVCGCHDTAASGTAAAGSSEPGHDSESPGHEDNHCPFKGFLTQGPVLKTLLCLDWALPVASDGSLLKGQQARFALLSLAEVYRPAVPLYLGQQTLLV